MRYTVKPGDILNNAHKVFDNREGYTVAYCILQVDAFAIADMLNTREGVLV